MRSLFLFSQESHDFLMAYQLDPTNTQVKEWLTQAYKLARKQRMKRWDEILKVLVQQPT